MATRLVPSSASYPAGTPCRVCRHPVCRMMRLTRYYRCVCVAGCVLSKGCMAACCCARRMAHSHCVCVRYTLYCTLTSMPHMSPYTLASLTHSHNVHTSIPAVAVLEDPKHAPGCLRPKACSRMRMRRIVFWGVREAMW